MINKGCFGGDESDIRGTFCRTRLAHIITSFIVLVFIATIYFTIDCSTTNTTRQCVQPIILCSVFGVFVLGIFCILIRWRCCWKEAPVAHDQQEQVRPYGEITPKKLSIGKYESQRVIFNPMAHHTVQEKNEMVADMAIITPLENANILLSNPIMEKERSRSSSKDAVSPITSNQSTKSSRRNSVEIANTLASNPMMERERSRSSSKHSVSPITSKQSKQSSRRDSVSSTGSAKSPKLPNDSGFTVDNPMGRV